MPKGMLWPGAAAGRARNARIPTHRSGGPEGPPLSAAEVTVHRTRAASMLGCPVIPASHATMANVDSPRKIHLSDGPFKHKIRPVAVFLPWAKKAYSRENSHPVPSAPYRDTDPFALELAPFQRTRPERPYSFVFFLRGGFGAGFVEGYLSGSAIWSRFYGGGEFFL